MQTAPFEGLNVTWGPKDSIWILGYQLTAERNALSAPPHAILRQFDRQGNPIGAAVGGVAGLLVDLMKQKEFSVPSQQTP